jgi:hypothetical protein
MTERNHRGMTTDDKAERRRKASIKREEARRVELAAARKIAPSPIKFGDFADLPEGGPDNE